MAKKTAAVKGPGIESVEGFTVTAVKAGIKKSGNLDMGLIVADKKAAAAGVFTKSTVVSPSVTLDKDHLKASGGYARAILVNAGNANTCTGAKGRKNALKCASTVAAKFGAKPEEVLVCSTGIIGHQLPMDKMLSGIESATANLGKAGTGDFARAIMTTDLTQKEAGVKIAGLGGVSIAGAAKGSGMIAPNMATMLGFILTDANVTPSVLKRALSEVVDCTFNCVTVDGDTSTNDSVLVLASGTKGEKISRPSGKAYDLFLGGLYMVSRSLSEMIAADGEGATKLVRVRVVGARSKDDARRCARTIAESPLVKTAMFGNDPNWGRILAAAGRSGCALKEEKTMVKLCGGVMYRKGTPVKFDAAALSKKMKEKSIALDVDLGLGKGECEMLTCDFSYDYVKINAEYHT
ncbi:MAG: bifunctional glutamate N-acetyltransferase/amino-acid acetyltransferase ArgJ [Planctomycetes bacterium]|nr:bifunctional glutamate N-acetyltransferase/amino-acid acetyltransferase ArgJ [Planctomycetota bacterium]